MYRVEEKTQTIVGFEGGGGGGARVFMVLPFLAENLQPYCVVVLGALRFSGFL